MAQGGAVAEPSMFPANCLSTCACATRSQHCAWNMAALEPPDLIVVHEMAQADGTHVEVAVTDDGRCC
eukprot:3587719-Pyramimonas_sp.AAC.1